MGAALTPATTATTPPAVLARDPQSVVFYDAKGQFVGVRRPGSGKPIEVEGLALVVEDVTGATGLELKSDPGVPAVYAGEILATQGVCTCARVRVLVE